MNSNWALALNRQALTQQFGTLTAFLWAQHISGRFRCTVIKRHKQANRNGFRFRAFFPIAAAAVSGVGLCRAHELSRVFAFGLGVSF